MYPSVQEAIVGNRSAKVYCFVQFHARFSTISAVVGGAAAAAAAEEGEEHRGANVIVLIYIS